MKHTLETLKERAENAIDNDEDFIYDVAAERSQIVDNVKHMKWFLHAIMEYLIDNFDCWSHLELKE